MPSNATDVPRILLNAPLPELIERLGVSIANAQAALDRSSLAIAQAMGTTMVEIDSQPRSLLELGFVPSFYAFTEATIEAKLSFTITESTEIGVNAEVGVQVGVFAAAAASPRAWCRCPRPPLCSRSSTAWPPSRPSPSPHLPEARQP
jgi:hypothetical protein